MDDEVRFANTESSLALYQERVKMKTYSSVATLLCLATLALFAQTPTPTPPPPPPSNGPSIEETVAFINHAFATQREFDSTYISSPGRGDEVDESETRHFGKQSLTFDGPCMLTYHADVVTTKVETFYDKKHRKLTPDKISTEHIEDKIDLQRVDPRTLLVGIGAETISGVSVFVPEYFAIGAFQQTAFGEVTKENPYRRLGILESQDTADRIARAYIHLAAPCYKPPQKPLF